MIDEPAPLLSFSLIVLSVFCGYVYFILTKSHQREAKRQLEELREDGHAGAREAGELTSLTGEHAEAGLLDRGQIAEFKRRRSKVVGIGTIVVFLVCFGLSGGSAIGAALGLVLGVSISYLCSRRMLALETERFQRELVFFLPVVMERLVMAVQAGIDIVPAIQTVVALEDSYMDEDPGHPTLPRGEIDPVTRLLGIVVRLCEAGLPFEIALREVTSRVDSTPVKHAFVHLAVAHKEGGELVAPLRELSDATQLYFQEDIERQIAVMPVKATVPLLVTFTGLLIMFVTSPILQIGKFTRHATPGQSSVALTAAE